MQWRILTGKCEEMLREFDDNTFDAVVTDPPYGIRFMAKKWDYDIPSADTWREILRVLKPGGHMLAFFSPRTYHRGVCAIEDAGGEVRDCLMWLYGTGFPKSLDVSKAIDKAAGLDGKRGPLKRGGERLLALKDGKRDGEGRWGNESGRNGYTTIPESTAAQQWAGWGTALKPAYEPIVLIRKPVPSGTIAANVMRYGTGAINIDACRVGERACNESGWSKSGSKASENRAMAGANYARQPKDEAGIGRWPSNVLHDGSDCVSVNMRAAARYFYCPKAQQRDRDEGLEAFEVVSAAQRVNRADGSAGMASPRAGAGRTHGAKNNHPTVKPTALMQYLCRLVTPTGGTILDPFTGSGSTGKAALAEGFSFVGCECDPEYATLARARLRHAVGGATFDDVIQGAMRTLRQRLF